MTNPDLPRPDTSFAEVRRQVEEGVRTGSLVLDLALLAPQLAPSLEDVLRHVQISLGAVKAEIANTELAVRGSWKVGQIPFGVEARFADQGGAVCCTVAIAPLRNAMSAIGGDFGRLLALLPIRPADFWLTLSTVQRQAARIDIEGHEVADAMIAEGRGYLMRFEGRLLALAGLEGAVFALAERLQKPVFRANLDKQVRIGEFIQLRISALAFASVEMLSVSGSGTIRLFGASLSCAGDLTIGLRSLGFSANVDAVLKHLDHVFFRGYSLRNSRVSVNGTVETYSVGVSGEFVIAGSGNSGAYEAQYAAGNLTPIPDLFQLEATRLTPSDVLTVITGATIRLPDSLDRQIVLEGVYLYYSTRDGLGTRSNVPSRRGVAMHSDIVLLGYRGYADVEVVTAVTRVRLLLDAISLAGILEIGGSGKATPGSFKGTKVKAGAIELAVDTERKEASGDLSVRFLRRSAIAARGTLGERALGFAVKASFPQPLGNLQFETELEHKRARMTARVDIRIGVKEFGVHIPRLASVLGNIAIDVGVSTAQATVSATIALGPLSLPLAVSLDASDIENLAQEIARVVRQEIASALADAVNWLRVALEELIRSGTQEIERGLANIGREFQSRFNRTAEDTARALKAAGYAMEQAMWVLLDNPIKNLMHTFGAVGAYTTEEIIKGLSSLSAHVNPEYLARDVGELLNAGGMRGEQLARAVSGLAGDIAKSAEALAQIGRPVREVAKFLHGAGKTATQAAEIIGGAFGDLDREVLKDSMTLVGYAEDQVARVVENLWREGGRFVRNLQEEVQRAWERYRPRIRITF